MCCKLIQLLRFVSAFSIAISLAAQAAHGDDDKTYFMSISPGAPGSAALLASDYVKGVAIARSLRNDPNWAAAAELNLCVSYTMLNDYARARLACQKAVNAALANKQQVEDRGADLTSDDLAKAYANRGVFRAMSDDLAGARKDFEKAGRLDRSSKFYSANLRLLQEQLLANSVAER